MWFKNRRAKWRKRERNALNAAAAAHENFKTGFSSAGLNFINQPFADPDTFYNYSSYNNWASKVPSPLTPKNFTWPVNPLSSVVQTPGHHHHHPHQVSPCFNSASSLSGSHVAGMPVSVGQAATSMIPGMSSGLGVAGSPVAASGAACPYTAPAAPHHPYGPPVYSHHRTAAGPDTCNVMTTSIASLRLKAKQHSSSYSSFSSSIAAVAAGNNGTSNNGPSGTAGNSATGGSISPVSSRASSGGGGLSACQYALATGGNNPHSPGPEHATARAQV